MRLEHPIWSMARIAITLVIGVSTLSRGAAAESTAITERSSVVNARGSASDHSVPGAHASGVDTIGDRVAILQDSLAGLGWVKTGHRDWSRYTHPGQCMAAVEVVQRTTVTRSQWEHPAPQADTLSAAARDAGRACAAKFSPRTVRAQDLLDYQRLAVVLNDVPLLSAIVNTQLSQAKTVDEKGSVIADAVRALNGRVPAQFAIGDSLIQHLRTLGPQARWWEVVVLRDLYWRPSLAFDTARDASIDRTLVEKFAALSHDDRMKAGLAPVGVQTHWLALQEYRRIPPEQFCPRQRSELLAEGGGGTVFDSVRGVTIQTFVNLSDATCPAFIRQTQQKIAPFTTGQWFYPGDSTVHGPLGYPIPGHVTLVLNTPLGMGRPTAQLAVYRRLFAQYAKDGLDIVLVHTRQGFAWGSADLTPQTEEQLIRWYDHDYLELPFPVAVYDSGATNIPATMFVGRDGHPYAMSVAADDEVVLDAFVKQALAEHKP